MGPGRAAAEGAPEPAEEEPELEPEEGQRPVPTVAAEKERSTVAGGSKTD